MLVNRIVTPRSFVVLGLILSEGGQETMYFVIILSHDYYFSEGGVVPCLFLGEGGPGLRGPEVPVLGVGLGEQSREGWEGPSLVGGSSWQG